MRTILTGFAIAAACTVSVGCGGEAAITAPTLDTRTDKPAPVGTSTAHADWLSRPPTLRDAADKAEATVIATVESVQAGEPLVAAADESNPTAIVTLRVRDRWRGRVPDRFQIRWLGAPGGYMDGDPPYEVGQDYVLMLVARGDGPWLRPESPDGRLQILGGRMRPLISDGPVADQARGRTVAEIKREVMGGN